MVLALSERQWSSSAESKEYLGCQSRGRNSAYWSWVPMDLEGSHLGLGFAGAERLSDNPRTRPGHPFSLPFSSLEFFMAPGLLFFSFLSF